MKDDELGVSIRFIRHFDSSEDLPTLAFDRALMLAMRDDRDIPFVEKLVDATRFLRTRVH